jgi:rhodanese-related sulfurtransferase
MNVLAQNGSEFDQYLEDLSKEFDIEQIHADSIDFSSVVLLDTREKPEHDVSRLAGSIWIGYDDFDISRIDSLHRDTEIIVYCSVGYRSSKIGSELKESGFTHVKNLYGGIFKWVNEGRNIYNNGKQTMKVHAYNKKWGRFLTNPSIIKVYR